MRQKSLALLHLIIILLVLVSPLWLDWRLIGLGVILYWLQLIIFKTCIISIAQYGDHQASFWAINVNRLMKVFNKQIEISKIRFFVAWILPILIFLFAILIQSHFKLLPLISI